MSSYQKTGWNMHHHIVELTKAGEFSGHQAARTILIWFGMNIAVSSNPQRGLQRGFVMNGCISQLVIAKATGLSQSAVSKAMAWLAEQGFINVTYRYEGKRQRFHSVEIATFDEQSEEDRKLKRPEPAAKLRLVHSEHSSVMLEHSSGIIQHSSVRR
jgi:DNA-binding transcriptional ArsR family regulator